MKSFITVVVLALTAGGCKPEAKITRLMCTIDRSDERMLFELNLTDKKGTMRYVNQSVVKNYDATILDDNYIIDVPGGNNYGTDFISVNRITGKMIYNGGSNSGYCSAYYGPSM